MRALILAVVGFWVCSHAVVFAKGKDDRNFWVHKSGWFKQGDGQTWTEKVPEGYYQFQEVNRTKDFVELYDATRTITVRLFKSKVEYRYDDWKAKKWASLPYKGKWEREPIYGMSQHPVTTWVVRFQVGNVDFNPGNSPYTVSWVDAAEYTLAKQANKSPAWRPVVGESVTFNFGNYYFRVDRRDGGSFKEVGKVTIDEKLKGLVSLEAP